MRKMVFSVEEFYHLYSRGVDKRVVFNDYSDYERFKVLMFLCNQDKPIIMREAHKDSLFDTEMRGDPLVAIGAWCLMPNHFHILAKEIKEGGISKYMRKIMTGYSMYFNRKNERTGSLFESAFKSQHIDTDEYLRHISAYIHLNPLSLQFPEWKKGVVDVKGSTDFINHYEHSSFLDYKEGSKRGERNILMLNKFPVYHSSFDEMVTDYQNWIDIINERNEDTKASPMYT